MQCVRLQHIRFMCIDITAVLLNCIPIIISWHPARSARHSGRISHKPNGKNIFMVLSKLDVDAFNDRSSLDYWDIIAQKSFTQAFFVTHLVLYLLCSELNVISNVQTQIFFTFLMSFLTWIVAYIYGHETVTFPAVCHSEPFVGRRGGDRAPHLTAFYSSSLRGNRYQYLLHI